MATQEEQRKTAFDGTIAKMCQANEPQKSNGFTLGWDVVVSYTEEQINARLREKWEKDDSKIVKTIEMKSRQYNEDTEMEETIVRTLELGAPLIEFSGGAVEEPAVNLIMPVHKGWRQKENAKGERYGALTYIPENAFRLRLTGIKLGTVTGKYEEIKMSKDRTTEGLSVVNSRTECVFRSDYSKPLRDDFEVSWVVLDFPTEGRNLNTKIEVTLPSSHLEHDKAHTLVNALGNSANDYFVNARSKIDLIEYALATVKNKPEFDGSNPTVDLTPVSFQMATFGASYHPKRSLSIFVHTRSGSNSGEKADLQMKWSGQWATSGSAPIPAGYTASLIINPELVFKAMLKPGLEKGGEWKVDDRRDDSKSGGVAFQARKQTRWYVSGFTHKYEATFNNCQVDVDSFSKDLKDDPIKIHIFQKETNGPPKAHIDWSFWTENEWTDSTQDPKWWNFGSRAGFGSANIRTTYTMNSDFDLKMDVTDTSFKFDINTDDMKKKWTFKQEAVDRTGNWFERLSKWIANLITAGPPEDVDKKRRDWMDSLSPDIDFESVGLGFFLTTNLLMPGAKVIHLDSKAGFRYPKDIVLVGDVVQGTDLLKQ